MTNHMIIPVHQAEKLSSGLSTGAEQDRSGTDHQGKSTKENLSCPQTTCLSTSNVKPSDCYFVNIIE